MKKEELERLIVDASDGILTASEIENLEKELRNHPDLAEDYQAIMKLPDLSNLYLEDLQTEKHQSSIRNIKQRIRELSYAPDTFEVISLNWFRRYALAASLAIFAITSLLSFMQLGEEQPDSEEVAEEMFYPVDENSIAENYVLYLEDLSDE